MDCLIEARGLTKSFGHRRAVDNLDLSVARGEVLGFLGPNGAGKTTTMRMLMGVITPDAGTLTIAGRNAVPHPADLRRRMGYLAEGAPLYGEMTAAAYLEFVADAHAINGSARAATIHSASETLGLLPVMQEPINTLSKGYARRVALAGAILHAPEILILDEPTDGLDPNQKQDVRRLIRTMSEDRAIIISTHILEEVDALCGRAVIINEGRIAANATPSELKAQSRYRGAVHIVVSRKDKDSAAEGLSRIDGVEAIEITHEGPHSRLLIEVRDGLLLGETVTGHLSSQGIAVHAFSLEMGRLDDVFDRLTTRREGGQP